MPVDKDWMREAAESARRLTPAAESQSEEQIRNIIARRFFAETGIPPHLEAGWAILEATRKKRQEVGYPMPPGGVLLLGTEAVVAGCLAEMHMTLAEALKVDPNRIRMRLENEGGRLRPVADVEDQADWIVPVIVATDTPKEAAQRYIKTVVEALSLTFRKDVGERLAHCQDRRPELDQEVEPWSENQSSKDG
jgi:hypothetical protein